MTFQIHALPHAPFAPLFALSDAALRDMRAVRVTADASPGFPCRVSLQDAQVGDALILINHAHLAVGSPYDASHAIYVREGAVQAQIAPGEVPQSLATRKLSLRGFDAQHMMLMADVVDGSDVAQALRRFFDNAEVAVVHIHNAKQGCFAATATRYLG